ncbi:MAG: type II secretion system protein [Chloroflexi bacterium HGW-Chloroflexi-5]|jgi:tight adherence protein C|nr:MAG: type II secretion system protein [Chloroflexi bacterium HGW-Chloroflexi-5]
MIPILVLIGLIIIIAVALVVIGLRNPQTVNDRLLEERLEEFSRTGEQVDLEKLEMSQPFTERVIYPLARKLGEITIKFTPQNWLNSIARKLELAGNPSKMDPTIFLATQFIMAVVFGGIMLLFMTVIATSFPAGQVFFYVVVITLIGFFMPQFQLSTKITKRQKAIRRAMPDALDLLTICVEAGLGFDAALNKVTEKWETQLSKSFQRVIQEIQLGKLRREALRDMAENIGIPEMTSFVAAVIQSEQLGVSMAKVLRIQADQMRIKRRQLAEEEAHKAPIKMLIPMAFLIFPSLLIVLFVPAVLTVIQSGVLGGL